MWEYDDIRKIQILAGIVALCPACHEVKHFGLATARERADIALNRLMRVNAWNKPTASLYVDKAFETWSDRSNHDWTADLSKLIEYGVTVEEIRMYEKQAKEERDLSLHKTTMTAELDGPQAMNG